jgi:DNA-binding MarR family transcriptional regulator
MLDVESATHLRGVVSRIARRLNASATSEGLTPTQASVLGLIAARGPLGLAQLAELEGLNPTMLSRVIGALTSAELIVRRPDPADLRAWQVAATAEGTRMHERIKNARAEVVSDSAARGAGGCDHHGASRAGRAGRAARPPGWPAARPVRRPVSQPGTVPRRRPCPAISTPAAR